MKRWILFTTYGWFMGILFVLGFALLGEVLFKMNDDSGGQAVVGIGMGAGVGLMQWLAIRKYLATSQRLFWFTLLGFTLAFILRDLVAEIINKNIKNAGITVEATIPFAVLFGAFFSSLLQYQFVFKAITAKASSWIIYCVIGWLLAALITMSSSMLNIKLGENFPKFLIAIIAILFLSIGGPILGYITGGFIVPRLKTYSASRLQA